jgi:hypothetical protein
MEDYITVKPVGINGKRSCPAKGRSGFELKIAVFYKHKVMHA